MTEEQTVAAESYSTETPASQAPATETPRPALTVPSTLR